MVLGLVDSGADASTFPFGYATLLGYSSATLTRSTSSTAGGNTTTFVAKAPSTAEVLEVPGVTVQMHPVFAQAIEVVVWGRIDFMTYFDVNFMETQQRFSITPH